ncbi:MAG: efflux RND transporter permease subunit [Bacteroidales bacterium]|nr:efflux RND transporter permease subunit [Bacteroidales bacterium]
MKLPKIASENYQFTIMLFIVLAFAGIFSYFNMPRTENPSVQIPGASIVVIYPGGSPKDLEEIIAIPIEESVNELEDIKTIETTIRDGIVTIAIEFVFNTDAKDKYDEVVSKVNALKNQLPDDIHSLETFKWSTSDVNILQFAFVSEQADYAELEATADNLKREIERVAGIRKVELHAYPEQEIRISLDVEKMALMNITLEQVASAIVASNTKIPGGSLVLGDKSFTLRSNASYEEIREIENTVVNSCNGQLVFLGNIATVAMDYKDQDYIGKFNGGKALFLTAQQKEDVNLFDIMDNVMLVVDAHRKQLPDNIRLECIFDQSYFVDNRINSFLINLLEGILIVGVLIFLTLGFRSSLLTMMAIPLSIIIGIWIIHVSGFGLQQISVAGMIVALGMLVDNSIVVVQNINRHIAMGYSKPEAAIRGAEQIAWPVISSTLTTVAAFIPIIMMKDKSGEFIKSLPVAVIATLMASLLIALTITPYLAGRVLRKPENGIQGSGFMRWITWVIDNPYRKILDLALRRRMATLTIAFFVFLVSVFVFIRFVGISFFPKAEQPQFLVQINMPEGTHISRTDEAARFVENILDTLPDVMHYATNVGHGNPRIYYNAFSKNYAENYAECYVRLTQYNVKKFDRMIKQLREVFSSYPEGEISVKEFEQGTPILAPVVVTLLGKNLDDLTKVSLDIENHMQQIQGIVNCENQLSKTKSDLYIMVNKDKANFFGVPVLEIDRTLRTLVSGAGISAYRDKEGKEFDITLRMQKNGYTKPDDLKKIFVKSISGKHIPLFQLVNLEFKGAPGLITHKDLQRSANITADIVKGYTLDEVLAPLTEYLNDYKLPQGITYNMAGELENRQESFGGMIEAIIIAMLTIFAILIVQFRSFVQPLIIFIAIPLALIGAIWAWFITGNTFSFTAFIGLISLVGIVVNNSIILVDFSNKLVGQGKSVTDAVKEAGQARFTPIILTSLTTIGGLLPLTIGGGTLWAPLAWGIIGGLLTSTLLTLIVTPAVYDLVTKWMHRTKRHHF